MYSSHKSAKQLTSCRTCKSGNRSWKGLGTKAMQVHLPRYTCMSPHGTEWWSFPQLCRMCCQPAGNIFCHHACCKAGVFVYLHHSLCCDVSHNIVQRNWKSHLWTAFGGGVFELGIPKPSSFSVQPQILPALGLRHNLSSPIGFMSQW